MQRRIRLIFAIRVALLSLSLIAVTGNTLGASWATSPYQSTGVPPATGEAGPGPLISTIGHSTDNAVGCSQGQWTAAMPAPVPMARYGFAQNGTDFYFMGGQIGSVINAAYKYSAATDQWTSLAPIPLPGGGYYTSAAYYSGKIYVVGGLTDDPSNMLHIYDIASNTWTRGPDMPQFTYGAATGAHNGRVYVAGGLMTIALFIYDIALNSWSAGSQLLSPYSQGGYTQVGQYLYLVGSSQGGTATQRLDMAAGTWSTGPTWTPARYDMAVASDGTRLYAIGGQSGNNTSVQVDELALADWPGGSWTPSPANLPAPRRANQAGFSTGTRIWSTGGADAGGVRVTDNLFRDTEPCLTATPTVGSTAIPTSTSGSTPSPSPTTTSIATQVTGATFTATPISSPTNTAVATATSTICPLNFADVMHNNIFYPFVKCLACRNIISGYQCGGQGEPCNTNSDPYFRPNTDITRGQIAKIVAEAAGFNEDSDAQIYQDVPTSDIFFRWINRLSNRGLIGGYPCGSTGTEPCVGPANRPYFRPNQAATRGQLAKVVSNAAGFQDPTTQQTYADVPSSNTFYQFIERLSTRGVIGGYPCGTTPQEPCDAQERPYFRWANNVTRGQASKIVANTFFAGCPTLLGGDFSSEIGD